MNIELSSLALADCSLLELSAENIEEYILEETHRHPVLFSSSFSSMPFVYQKNIIFVSWDKRQIIVERILLSREKAFPASDSWFLCASLYRQATVFSYRSQGTKVIIHEAEFGYIIHFYKKLLLNIKNFISLNETKEDIAATNISLFESLLTEAEFAFHKDNQNIGIVQL